MLSIPLQTTASQTLTVLLANQNVRLNIYQKTTGLFVDVFVSDTPVCTTILVHDRDRFVRSEYSGFIGDFIFVDTQGADDPVWDGLGVRYQLIYLEADDL
jgi:hypothetical protein